MKKFKLDKNNILILIIGLLSIGNILFQLKIGNYLSIINSIVGIIGVALFFLKKDAFKYFVWVWIFAQAIIINQTIIDPIAQRITSKPIFDLAQLFQIKFGFYVGGINERFGINFNLLVILYFFLFSKLKTTALLGKSFGLLILKGNNNITFDEGIYTTLSRRVNLDNDDNWLLGDLSSEIMFYAKRINKILVRTNDGELTDTFRIIYDGQKLEDGVNPISKFERVDWLIWE